MGPVPKGYRVTQGLASRHGWRLWRQYGVGRLPPVGGRRRGR